MEGGGVGIADEASLFEEGEAVVPREVTVAWGFGVFHEPADALCDVGAEFLFGFGFGFVCGSGVVADFAVRTVSSVDATGFGELAAGYVDVGVVFVAAVELGVDLAVGQAGVRVYEAEDFVGYGVGAHICDVSMAGPEGGTCIA